MITALLVAAVLAGQPEPGPGPEARSAPLEDVFPFWTDYQALAVDERDAFDLTYTLSAPLRGDGTDFSFWVETGGNTYAKLDISEPVIPPDVESFERGYQLFTDAPRGAVQVRMTLTLPGPPKTEYSRQDMEAALAQSGNAMRRAMGIRSLFMPRLDTIRFVFDGPAPEADFLTEDGGVRPITAVFSHEVLVTPGSRESRNISGVRFGRPPLYAVLETGR